MSRADYEKVFADYLGIKSVVWLGVDERKLLVLFDLGEQCQVQLPGDIRILGGVLSRPFDRDLIESDLG